MKTNLQDLKQIEFFFRDNKKYIFPCYYIAYLNIISSSVFEEDKINDSKRINIINHLELVLLNHNLENNDLARFEKLANEKIRSLTLIYNDGHADDYLLYEDEEYLQQHEFNSFLDLDLALTRKFSYNLFKGYYIGKEFNHHYYQETLLEEKKIFEAEKDQ